MLSIDDIYSEISLTDNFAKVVRASQHVCKIGYDTPSTEAKSTRGSACGLSTGHSRVPTEARDGRVWLEATRKTKAIGGRGAKVSN